MVMQKGLGLISIYISICLLGVSSPIYLAGTIYRLRLSHNPMVQAERGSDVISQLRFHILEAMDQFPCRELSGRIEQREIEQASQEFSSIQSDKETFQSIIHHLGLENAQFGDDEKLLVYCDYRRLQRIHLEPWGDKFRITLETNPNNMANKEVFLIDRQGRFSIEIAGKGITVHSFPEPAREESEGSSLPGSTVSMARLNAPNVRYLLVQHFSDIFVCGPHIVSRDYAKQQIDAFAKIQGDRDALVLIGQRLGLKNMGSLSDEDKILVYQQYARWGSIVLERLLEKYRFQMRIREKRPTDKRPALFMVTGLVDQQGNVYISRKDAIVYFPCPR